VYSFFVRKFISILFHEKEDLLIFNNSILLIDGRSSELSYCFYDILENNLYNFLSKHLKKGDIFIDIGAHIGYYTILASKEVGDKGKVIAFEPSIANFNRLIKNIKLNQCKNVVSECFAISNKRAYVKLFTGVDTFTYSLIQNMKSSLYSFVPSISLDKYVFSKRIKPKMIKIDVEGDELDVIESGMKVIKIYKPILIVEFHPIVLNRKFSRKLRKILGFLKKHYKFYILWNGNVFQIENIQKYITIIYNKYRMPIYPKFVFFPVDYTKDKNS
jgi:FkbM family methyltransferase